MDARSGDAPSSRRPTRLRQHRYLDRHKTISLDLKPTDTADDVKQEINRHAAIFLIQQSLDFGEKTFEGASTLARAGLEEELTLRLTVREVRLMKISQERMGSTPYGVTISKYVFLTLKSWFVSEVDWFGHYHSRTHGLKQEALCVESWDSVDYLKASFQYMKGRTIPSLRFQHLNKHVQYLSLPSPVEGDVLTFFDAVPKDAS